MAMKKFLFIKTLSFTLLCALFMFVAGCGESKQPNTFSPGEVTEYENHHETPQKGGTLRLALIGARTLNPILAENENNHYVLGLLYDSLFKISPDGIIEPSLCENFVVSPDGMQYEFVIKDNISFHNGTPLTVHDVASTFSYIMEKSTLYNGKFANVASYSVSGSSFIVNLYKPTINFEALMTFPVLSQADLQTDMLTYVPNGTGRFKVQSYKNSKELYLTVNQNYHKQISPYIDDILIYLLRDAQTAISMLENLQIDLLPSSVIDLYSYTPKRNFSAAEYSNGQMTFIGINNQHQALLSDKTRKAIAYAVDKENLISSASVKYAQRADFPVPDGSFWHYQTLPAQMIDKEKAINLLREDGWQDRDNDGVLDKEVYGEKVNLLLNILVNSENTKRVKIAETLSKSLADIGIASNLVSVPFAVYSEKAQNRDYDLLVGEISISENYDLSFLLKTDENIFGISNEGIDQTLNALSILEGVSQKQELFHELCGYLYETVPIIPIYFENEMIVFDNRIKGAIVPAEYDIFYSIDNWFISVADK